jgi:large subunit ribosomal protein L24
MENKAVKLKIRKGDNVMVIAGNSKGKTGQVIAVDTENQKVLVEGLNMVTRHTKPSAKSPNGGLVKKEAYLHVCKVMVVDPKTSKPTRVGRKLDEKGKLVRFAKKSGEELSNV